MRSRGRALNFLPLHFMYGTQQHLGIKTRAQSHLETFPLARKPQSEYSLMYTSVALIITFAKEVIYNGRRLSECLFVSLLATLRENFWTDLHDKEELIKFWKSSACESGSRNFVKYSSTLRDRGISPQFGSYGIWDRDQIHVGGGDPCSPSVLELIDVWNKVFVMRQKTSSRRRHSWTRLHYITCTLELFTVA